jgi:hypothetical protein
LGDECFGITLIVLDVNTDEYDLPGELAECRGEQGCLGTAGVTPGRPHIDDHRMTDVGQDFFQSCAGNGLEVGQLRAAGMDLATSGQNQDQRDDREFHAWLSHPTTIMLVIFTDENPRRGN